MRLVVFTTLLCIGAIALAEASPDVRASAEDKKSLTLTALETEPKRGLKAPSDKRVAKMVAAVEKAPKERELRFKLVRGLMAAKKFPEALEAAKAWRAQDAYNLVVVRLIGDIYTEMGDVSAARRAYSAVVELLPEDASAHRALATVLKQSGELKAAYDRLTVSRRLEPKDLRIAFELADVAHRLDRRKEAIRLFKGIVDTSKNKAVRYPAKQRLAQLWARERRQALQDGNVAGAATLKGLIESLKVKGGVVNDIKVYLSWDTNRSDVDLWVVNPAGQKVYYKKKRGRFGGALFDDVTSGYGPESFTAKTARKGSYVVKVHYYATSRSRFTAARGEVVVVLHEGTAQETRHVLPYRLNKEGDVVTVAKIAVGGDS